MQFGLYVSAVEGRLVTRFGTRPQSYIGATRDTKDPSQITWDTKTIVPIPEAEYVRFRREYDRECASGGGLKRCCASEYEAQHRAHVEAKRKAAEAAAKAPPQAASAASTGASDEGHVALNEGA